MKRVLIVCLIFSMVSGSLWARKVSGRVTGEGQPLGGVIVTDGYNFTQTNSRGSYRLDVADSARFVYIVTPSGYVADFSSGTPKFYQKLGNASRYSFDLDKTAVTDDYHIFMVSDPQTQKDEHFEAFAGKPASDLVEQAAFYGGQAPTAGVILGDIAWNYLEHFQKYKNVIKSASIPFYPVIGNHDHIQNRAGLASVAEFENQFGPVNWAFCMGNDLVIGLDNLIFHGSGLETPYKTGKYDEGYTQVELDFVKNLLSYFPKTTRVFITQHSPILISTRNKLIVNGNEMVAILDGYRSEVVSGHTHYMCNNRLSESVREHNVASICGAWWDADLCIDGTPRGYEIFSNVDDSLTWKWHSVDYPDDYKCHFIGLGESANHPNSVVVNVWDWDETWSVTWTEDGKEMGPLTPVKDVDPLYVEQIHATFGDKKIPGFKRPVPRAHYFAASPSEGAQVVEITVSDSFGNVVRKTINLQR